MTTTELKLLKLQDEEVKSLCPECGTEMEGGVCPMCEPAEEKGEAEESLEDEGEIE